MKNSAIQEQECLHWRISNEIKKLFSKCKNIIIPDTRDELIDLSVNGKGNKVFDVGYEIQEKPLDNLFK